MEKHLWEVDHPYYCSTDNWFKNDCAVSYENWESFFEAESHYDHDLNLVFRWDWKEEVKFNGDASHRNGELLVFWMAQRKGIFRSTTVKVCRNDEPQVIEFLKPRFAKMLELWEPFAVQYAANVAG